MLQSKILVSVVIPVKNGDSWLESTLPAIFKQKVQGEFEVIVIDSGSSDRTLEILKQYDIKLYHISPSEFNHGETRNFGVKLSRGEFVVMTVQDAKPSSDYWLQNLLDQFIDEKIAGVCGQQIVPHLPVNNPVQWFRPVSNPGIKQYYFEHASHFTALPPAEQLKCCRWDDVNAMYRRDVLLKIPFQKVSFGEDALWAKEALLNGYKIVYNTAAQVEHYHLENPEFTFNRNFAIRYNQYIYFNVIPEGKRNLFLDIIKFGKILVMEKDLSIMEKFKWLVYNYRISVSKLRSDRLFIIKEKEGVSSLADAHNRYCGVVPQAIKPRENGVII